MIHIWKHKMWFSATPFEICFSTTMFYSIFFISKCRSDDIPRGIVWKGNGSFQIYVHKIPPRKSANLSDAEKNHLAFKAWLLSTISVGIIACFCCVCWKFYKKGLSRSPPSHVAVLPPRLTEIDSPASRTVLSFQINHNVNTGVRNPSTGTGNIYNRGVVNFAFSSSVRNLVSVPSSLAVPPLAMHDRPAVPPIVLDDCLPVPPLEVDDQPPDYSVVVSENFNYGLATSLHPQISQTKKVETPPPDYSTLSPFDNCSRFTYNTEESFV